MGELVIFDTSKGRHEASGAVQKIPGYGKKVEPKVADRLVDGSWPKFLHPYPLSDKHFLVACLKDAKSQWGLYYADVHDNLIPLYHTANTLLENLDNYTLEHILREKNKEADALANKAINNQSANSVDMCQQT